MSGIAVRDVSQGILGLHSLLGGDARKLNLVGRAFDHSAQMDLARLEKPQDGDWSEEPILARRIAMDCAQVLGTSCCAGNGLANLPAPRRRYAR